MVPARRLRACTGLVWPLVGVLWCGVGAKKSDPRRGRPSLLLPPTAEAGYHLCHHTLLCQRQPNVAPVGREFVPVGL